MTREPAPLMRRSIAALALLAVFLNVPLRCVAAPPRLFIEDNDFLGPGGSDIASTLPLITNPAVRVLGFTVVTGDGWCAEETAYLLRFLEVAKRTNIPVIKGAVFPLLNTPQRMKTLEGAYGTIAWKGAFNDAKPGAPWHPLAPFFIPPNPAGTATIKPAPGNAVDFLLRAVHRYPHQITIIENGPMTTLALATRIDPAFPSLVKELVFMGGLIDVNVAQVRIDTNLFSDFNILFDPEAAHIVLTAAWPKIISLGNVTNTTLMSPALVQRMVAVKTPITTYLAKYTAAFPLWDELTAAVAVDPSLATKQLAAYMDVDLAPGMHYGAVRVWPAASAPHAGERIVTIVEAVDLKRFYAGFIRAAQAPLPAK